MAQKIYYFDNAATTPLCEAAKNAMIQVMDDYGNASALYSIGREVNKRLDEAREMIARCIGAASKDEILFTSGGTEGDNAVINHFFRQNMSVITTPIEHSAVLNAARDAGECLLYNADDLVDVAIEPTLRYGVSCMMANNETGVINPIYKIRKNLHSFPFHTDAVQAMGHIPIDVQWLNVDFLSASAHKFNGPKGVGFLYVKKGTDFYSFIKGGEQEFGARAGTENLMGVCGMAAALKENHDRIDTNYSHMSHLRDFIQDRLMAEIPEAKVNGNDSERLPGHLNITLPFLDGHTLQTMLNTHGICISTGSACHSNSMDASHVMKAIGLSTDQALRTIRISVGVQNTLEESIYLCDCIVRYINEAREMFQRNS